MQEETSEELRSKLYDLMGRFRRERYVPAEMLCGMTHGEMQVIRCVAIAEKEGEPLRPSDMARRFGVTPSAISQCVKKLQAQGYVERIRSDEDSRSVALVLTEKGDALAQEGRRVHEAFMAELFDYVGTESMGQLIATLERILEFCERNPAIKRCDGREEGNDTCA
ncbi:MAG: MarR family transcriptional regulator [Slackia sp.]|nr:MarR family transcriptional regulator [Slackia sp.]